MPVQIEDLYRINRHLGLAIDILTGRLEARESMIDQLQEKVGNLEQEVECYEERDDRIDEDACELAERILALPHDRDGSSFAYQRWPRARHIADIIRAYKQEIANLEAKLKKG